MTYTGHVWRTSCPGAGVEARNQGAGRTVPAEDDGG